MRPLLAQYEMAVGRAWPPRLPQPAGFLVPGRSRGNVAAHVERFAFGLDGVGKSWRNLARLPEQADGRLAIAHAKKDVRAQKELFGFTAVAAGYPFIDRMPSPRAQRPSQASRQSQQHP
jgi:hypothetical protein